MDEEANLPLTADQKLEIMGAIGVYIAIILVGIFFLHAATIDRRLVNHGCPTGDDTWKGLWKRLRLFLRTGSWLTPIEREYY